MSDITETPEATNAEVSSETSSAGEPVATGEPVAAAEPSSEGTEAGEQAASNDASVNEAFPSADDFDWERWDGSYEGFDERLRPWGERLHSHYDALNESSKEQAIFQALQDQAQWKDMYNALAMGEEDPRLAQLSTELLQRNSYVKDMELKLSEQRKAMESLAGSEATRYMEWFESVYADRLQENPEAAKLSIPLLEIDGANIPPHEAFEIAMMGEDAVKAATELIGKGNSIALVKELLQLRTKGEVAKVPVAPPRQQPQPAQSASIVAGAEETAAPPRPRPKKSTANMPRHQARAAAVDAIFERFKL